MSRSLTVVLYSREQALQFLQDQPHAERVYPLTPSALVEVLDRTHLPLLCPRSILTDYSHRRIIAQARRIERTLVPQIIDCPDLSDAGKEVFRNVFHIFANSVFYLYEALRGTGDWLIYDGQCWQAVHQLDSAVELMLQNIRNSRYGMFSLNIGARQRWKLLLRSLNFILIKCFIKRRSIWMTGYVYNLKAISAEIAASGEAISTLYLGVADERSVLRTLKILCGQVFPRFRKDSAVEYIPVVSRSRNYSKLFSRILARSSAFQSSVIEQICADFIAAHVSYTESLIPPLESLFKEIKPERVLAHQLRWMDAPAVAQVAQSQGITCTLISHGSHTVPANLTAQYEQDDLADGLMVSSLASEAFVQSPLAEQAAVRLTPALKLRRSKPLMWGHDIPPRDAQDGVFTILYAGTYKFLGARPWIYETSNEFIYGLQCLIQAVYKVGNIRLIIRVREEPLECSFTALKRLLPKAPNWELSTGGHFRDDLQRADMLISFASTTLEEALFARRPVGLFGGSSRYRHLPGTSESPSLEHRNAVYHLKVDTLQQMLRSIAKVHINRPLSDEELRSYIWESGIPGWQDFLNELI